MNRTRIAAVAVEPLGKGHGPCDPYDPCDPGLPIGLSSGSSYVPDDDYHPGSGLGSAVLGSAVLGSALLSSSASSDADADAPDAPEAPAPEGGAPAEQPATGPVDTPDTKAAPVTPAEQPVAGPVAGPDAKAAAQQAPAQPAPAKAAPVAQATEQATLANTGVQGVLLALTVGLAVSAAGVLLLLRRHS